MTKRTNWILCTASLAVAFGALLIWWWLDSEAGASIRPGYYGERASAQEAEAEGFHSTEGMRSLVPGDGELNNSGSHARVLHFLDSTFGGPIDCWVGSGLERKHGKSVAVPFEGEGGVRPEFSVSAYGYEPLVLNVETVLAESFGPGIVLKPSKSVRIVVRGESETYEGVAVTVSPVGRPLQGAWTGALDPSGKLEVPIAMPVKVTVLGEGLMVSRSAVPGDVIVIVPEAEQQALFIVDAKTEEPLAGLEVHFQGAWQRGGEVRQARTDDIGMVTAPVSEEGVRMRLAHGLGSINEKSVGPGARILNSSTLFLGATGESHSQRTIYVDRGFFDVQLLDSETKKAISGEVVIQHENLGDGVAQAMIYGEPYVVRPNPDGWIRLSNHKLPSRRSGSEAVLLCDGFAPMRLGLDWRMAVERGEPGATILNLDRSAWATLTVRYSTGERFLGRLKLVDRQTGSAAYVLDQHEKEGHCRIPIGIQGMTLWAWIPIPTSLAERGGLFGGQDRLELVELARVTRGDVVDGRARVVVPREAPSASVHVTGMLRMGEPIVLMDVWGKMFDGEPGGADSWDFAGLPVGVYSIGPRPWAKELLRHRDILEFGSDSLLSLSAGERLQVRWRSEWSSVSEWSGVVQVAGHPTPESLELRAVYESSVYAGGGRKIAMDESGRYRLAVGSPKPKWLVLEDRGTAIAAFEPGQGVRVEFHDVLLRDSKSGTIRQFGYTIPNGESFSGLTVQSSMRRYFQWAGLRESPTAMAVPVSVQRIWARIGADRKEREIRPTAQGGWQVEY